MTDLKEFENNHSDLIRQCVLQGSRIYEGLLQMASSSRVTVYDGKDKKQMIRFDIPAEVDPVVGQEKSLNFRQVKIFIYGKYAQAFSSHITKCGDAVFSFT